MKIALFGASGNIGKRIGAEALERGHEVTALVRRRSRSENNRMRAVSADITDPVAVAIAIAGHDAVITAVGPAENKTGNPMLVQAAKSLIEALNKAKVRRLIVVGGAGSLESASGQDLLDTPDFPAEWKALSVAHRDAAEVYLANVDLDWTYISPAASIEPGSRTSKFRIGSDKLITDSKGKSAISMEDFAVLVIDELEKPRAIRQRLTAAY